VCPRYEGVDDRVRSLVDLELSIGDFVVSGGEIPALLVIDAVLRLLPGAIDAQSTVEESFSHGLLEYPQYTRPPVFRDMGVPDILTSGHHGAVASWRHEQALLRTQRQRPDLLGEDGPSGAPPPVDRTTEAGLAGDRQGGDVLPDRRSGGTDV
jgi:tRNA (guanine37-N1)-methyltransferase